MCGGDGTVSWIISLLEGMGLERWPPIGILPLGTGNDLARVHGWGGGYNNESLIGVRGQRCFVNCSSRAISPYAFLMVGLS